MKIRAGLIRFLALILFALPIAGIFANQADAATSRVAIIKDLKGTVQVKKSGGTKQFKAFTKMSLNEGDILFTGEDSTAVLQFSNGTTEDDKISVSANTTLTFSKLSDKKGTRTKVSMLNGTAWVDVKSIASKNDEFTIETPTAIMGVRGTHLLASVDPMSNISRLTVVAGVVNMTPKGNSESVDVYPSEKAVMLKSDKGAGEISIAPVNLDLLMLQNEPFIVEAILKAAGDIVKENKEKLERYFNNAGAQTSEEINRKKSNIENLLGAIADSAVKGGVLTKERVDTLIHEAELQSGVQIDLSKKGQQLSEQDKQKQENQRQKEEAANKQAEQERIKQEEALKKKLEEERKQKEESNRKAEEAKKKHAESAYLDKLAVAEKIRYQEDKRKLEGLDPVSPPNPIPGNIAKSTNADLAGITLNPGVLSFSRSTLSYYVGVLKSVQSLQITPTVSDSGKATVKVNGIASGSGSASNISLGSPGTDTTVAIQVTAENGNTKTYSLTVHRDDAISSVTLPSNLGIQFDPSKLSYVVPPVTSGTNSVTMAFGSAEDASNMKIRVTVNGSFIGDYDGGQSFNVSLGDQYNEVVVSLVPKVGSSQFNKRLVASIQPFYLVAADPEPTVLKSYTFKIWKSAADDGSADLLGVRVNDSTATSANNSFTASVAPDATSAALEFYTRDPSDKILWNGEEKGYGERFNYPLSAGQSTFTGTVTVKGADATVKNTYSLSLNRTLIYTLNYQAGANGKITGDISQTVESGSDGTTVTAVPDAGYHFVKWSDDVTTAARTDTSVTGDIDVTATFAINTYKLNYTAGTNGLINGVASQTVDNGSNGTTVTAVPDAGYHFVKWSDGVTTAARTDTNVTADIDVTATFAINTYTLKYTAGTNGLISGVASQTVESRSEGTTVTAVPDAGYHFVKWSDGVITAARTDTNVTADIVVTATFAINTYTLKYTAGTNGSIDGDTPQTVNNGSNGTTVTAMPKPGYHFVKWSDGVTTAARTDTNVTADIDVTATFAINAYMVTYNGNGYTNGSVPVSVNQDDGSTVTVAGNSGNLTKSGYSFAGWNTKTDGSGTSYAPGATFTLSADVTLYAQWSINSYTVTYDGNGNDSGSVPSSVTQNANTTVTIAGNTGNLTKTGSTFAGWNTSPYGNGVNYTANDTLTLTQNVTLYAKWATNGYTVTFNSNGGTSVSSQNVNYSAKVSEPVAPSKTGYSFAGWYSNDTLSTTFDFNSGITSSITLYAKWIPETYTVTFVTYGGSSINSQSVNYGEQVLLPTAPTKSGYLFVGWYTDSDLTIGFDFNTAVTGNMVLYAKWTLDTPITLSRFEMSINFKNLPLFLTQSIAGSDNIHRATVLKLFDIFGFTIKPVTNYGIASITVQNGSKSPITESHGDIYVAANMVDAGLNHFTITIVDTSGVSHTYQLDLQIGH
ncbi:InlB B-repeat-containing protein [Cohnella candidum]|uniref:Cadherin-like beta sandwich domain-containing protein n=1 Tax=Cohnella candidum TaxID=2674991 RepID=A0A3G3JY81_9BACL|nr:InlB B-repeat-containing protein [Cohnella candidum]AYQ73122.1 hypothetical protein EAV92_11425 [Cohnella candidum]